MVQLIETDTPDPVAAADHFARRLRFETDCDDVAEALASGEPDFTVIDARSHAAYAAGHIPGSLNLERPFVAAQVAALPPGLLVVYCWGPGCNGALKTARQLAEMGRSVKEMLGGFEYWVREGHPIEGADMDAIRAAVDSIGIVKLRGAVSCLC
ncbi:MAG TPA: rhodanese-like domain-containing protein [Candidatus Dormibacteraeota bacterium]|jgi:rhodanese-related sulfurtransferase|nr:rhodanese-like domain-containing protein [Candidatus Dormibacteraeota bacterium]